MRQIKHALRSSKAATVVAMVAIGLYALTEFGDHPSYMAAAKLPAGSTSAAISNVTNEGKFDIGGIPTPAPRPTSLPEVAQPDQLTVLAMLGSLENASFNLSAIRGGTDVPRVFVSELPVDIQDVDQVKLKKDLFISVTLPLILEVNDKIRQERNSLKHLMKLRADGQSWSGEQIAWVGEIAERYKGSITNLEELLTRVDIIPVSLALAQSIEESGWGTSRFARLGNALYGQRVWAEGKGIVPHERAEGEAYEVRSFGKLGNSVASYALNLNRHVAYEGFREGRARLRAAGLEPNGYTLAASLLSYSERGEEYVQTLRMLMRVNDLSQFDNAKLAPKQVAQASRLSSN
ncbi:hypothetical protein GUA87_03250 [Sneathiella sp. P13V-1]|uniref:glucosaminidase domain-containing protein n=1 Tax=Sneathiella sp. P13V-1 TaxID=2697366 RepID=UPI00187B7E07|nr:glucosaminidase domain-containing protein [Sneathiella sp. P13V-1]MBE7635844.1 hypothetical protein [Sneathiella sp. P13V-1]